MSDIHVAEIELRVAHEDDVQFIEQLTKRIVLEKYFSPRQLKVTKSYLQLRLKDKNVYVIIAEKDNERLGYIDAEICQDGTCYLARLAVMKESRGMKIGHVLFPFGRV